VSFAPARQSRPPGIIIGTFSEECCGMEYRAGGQSAFGSAVWPVANLALFLPLTLGVPYTVVKLWAANGSAVSGNIDVGLYDEAGNRLTSAGSTAQAGTNTIQEFNIADLLLPRGTYYIGCALDNATGTIQSNNAAAVRNSVLGMLEAASAFPLPNPVTFATMTTAYCPFIGIAGRTLVV
jgi:hypothetical protein